MLKHHSREWGGGVTELYTPRVFGLVQVPGGRGVGARRQPARCQERDRIKEQCHKGWGRHTIMVFF